jgi:hypothetical protein
MTYKIYKLIHPIKGVIYVGKTTRGLRERKSWGYKSNKELQKIYKECNIELIEETNDKTREDFWINQFDNLLNIQRGSGLGKNIINNSACKKWKMKNPESIKNIQKRYYDKNRQTILEKKKIKYKEKVS